VKRLKEIMASVFGIEPSDIHEESSMENTENWDSFNHLVLINEIEEEMSIRFTMKEVQKIRDFKELSKSIGEKKKNET